MRCLAIGSLLWVGATLALAQENTLDFTGSMEPPSTDFRVPGVSYGAMGNQKLGPSHFVIPLTLELVGAVPDFVRRDDQVVLELQLVNHNSFVVRVPVSREIEKVHQEGMANRKEGLFIVIRSQAQGERPKEVVVASIGSSASVPQSMVPILPGGRLRIKLPVRIAELATDDTRNAAEDQKVQFRVSYRECCIADSSYTITSISDDVVTRKPITFTMLP